MILWIKRYILLCLSPLMLGLSLIGLGLICLWSGWRPKLGRILAVGGLLVLFLSGYGQFSRNYLARRENMYDPLNLAVQPAATVAQLRHVVVLGAGHVSDPRLPITSQIGGSSLYRLVEGIRLHRLLPGSRLILTGGPGFDKIPNAEIVAEVAVLLGVRKEDIVVLGRPTDTREEAAEVKTIVGAAPFALVTSGVHMPRAVRIFQAEGMNPLPAPTEFCFPRKQAVDPTALLPTAGGLGCTEWAMYELVASLQEAVRGW